MAAELKSRKVSLQHIRAVVSHLRSRSYPSPLAQLTFATVGHEVYFMHDDGTWEGDLQTDQIVMREVLNLDSLRRRIAAGTQRDRSLVGQVERRRGAMGSKPVFAGKHVWLRCSEMDAAQLVEEHIIKLTAALGIHKDVWIRLSADELTLSFAWT